MCQGFSVLAQVFQDLGHLRAAGLVLRFRALGSLDGGCWRVGQVSDGFMAYKGFWVGVSRALGFERCKCF